MGDLRGEMRSLGEQPNEGGSKQASKTPTLLIAQVKKHIE